jgi:hypothetical protein
LALLGPLQVDFSTVVLSLQAFSKGLQIETPSFLTWRVDPYAEWKSGLPTPMGVVGLGAIPQNDVRVTVVCFMNGSNVLVGDFNVSFTVDYYWSGRTNKPHSYVNNYGRLRKP